MIRDIAVPFKATYKESAARRISLAEKLRKLPLSFFAKRDLAELVNSIMRVISGSMFPSDGVAASSDATLQEKLLFISD